MNVFELVGTIAIQGMDTISSQMTTLGSTAATLGDRMTTFGNTLINNVTKPITNLVTEGVKYNMSMEDLKTSFEVMLGSAEKAGAMLEKLKEMGAKTPFDTEQLATYTQTMLAFGYTEENVIPIMSKLGDVSLGNNAKMTSLTRTMGQINSLGRLQGGDLNQLIGQGWNPLNEITARTGETMEQVRDRMSKGKVSYKEVEQALIDATSAGGRFYEGMDKGSQTTSGKLSTLRDNFMSFLGSAVEPLSNFLGNTLIPALINITNHFANISTPVKTAALVVAALAAAIGPLIVVFGTMIGLFGTSVANIGLFVGAITSAPVLIGVAIAAIVAAITGILLTSSSVRDSIKEHFNNIVDAIKDAANWIKQHIDDIKNAFEGFIGILKGGNLESINQFKEAMTNMFPNHTETINSIINGLTSFRDIVITVRDGIIEFASKVIEVVTPIKDMFANTFSNLDWSPVLDAFESLKNAASAAMPIIEGIATVLGVTLAAAISVVVGVFNGLIAALPNIVAFFTNIITAVTSLCDVVYGLFTGNFDMIKTGASEFVESVIGIYQNFVDSISNFIKGLVEGIITFFQSLYDTLVGNSIIPDMLNKIIELFTNMKDQVTTFITDLVNKVIELFTSMKDKVIEFVTNLVDKSVELFTNLKDKVTEFVTNLVDKVIELFTNMKDKVTEFVTNLKDKVIELFTSMKDKAIEFVTNLVDNVKTLFTTLSTDASNTISSFVTTIKNYFNDLLTNGKNLIQQLVDGIKSILNTLGTIATDAFNAMVNAINNAVSSAKTAATNVASGIKEAINSIASDLVTSGANLIQSLIDGITSKAQDVADAATNIAGKVADAIGWESPTKEGPGSESDKWPVNLIDMMSEGLEGNIDKVKISATKVASAIKDSLGEINVNSKISDIGVKNSDLNPVQTHNENTRIDLLNVEIKLSDLQEIQNIKDFINMIKVEAVTRGGAV